MRYLVLNTLIVFSLTACAQNTKSGSEQAKSGGIQWISFPEAVKRSEKEKKKLLIDVYTDWCGWCKKMEASTYENKKLIEYINNNFYAVKLDAEMNDSVVFRGHIFRKTEPGKKSAPHELAVALLNGKMGYPTTVFLDEDFNMLSPVPGYLGVEQMEMYLKFFGENLYSKVKWEDFQSSFKSSFID